ncbi:serine hydrolase domain-containing protein [Sphingobacterium suaedae]|uniref:Serine hydrolase domain-containing protein n=1 Tax=Sphingobacterium suaedae TaxID=1686402 RepID=A0ABW5KD45_9SPHI
MRVCFKMLLPVLTLLHQSIFGQLNVEDSLMSIANEFKAVGLAVVVVKEGKPIYHKAVGMKDIQTRTPLTTKNLFRIASISKSFSATAVMQLVEQGKLSLDDDFGDLIGFPIRHPKYPETVITLRMVLSHTSSINDSNGYFDLDVINPTKNENWSKSYNDYKPGTGYAYCNLNYNMVGAVLERVTGERFDRYITQKVLNPLQIRGGYCVDSLDKEAFATLYTYDTVSQGFIAQPGAYNPRSAEIRSYRLGHSTPIFSPTGGMKISPEDLATYMIMHMQFGSYQRQNLLHETSAKLMQTAVHDQERYGLALLKTNQLIPGVELTGHTGSAYGLYSAMFFNPASRYGFIVVTNGCIPTYQNDFPALTIRTINFLYRNLIQ